MYREIAVTGVKPTKLAGREEWIPQQAEESLQHTQPRLGLTQTGQINTFGSSQGLAGNSACSSALLPINTHHLLTCSLIPEGSRGFCHLQPCERF